MLGSQTQICTHTFSLHTTTQVRPQGCQVRKHDWRQLLKLVAAKVQRAVTKQNIKIDQIEPKQIVSASDHDSSGGVFVTFRSSCGIITLHHLMHVTPPTSCCVSFVHISSHNSNVNLQTADWKTIQHPDYRMLKQDRVDRR
jgi:hypothetical protein